VRESVNSETHGRTEDKFSIPPCFFGREKEQKIILKTLEQVRGGTKKLLLVSGAPGIGKSALISTARKFIVKKPVFFIQGKFEQFGGNVPYKGIIQAFQCLINQVLSESAAKQAAWKKEILDVLGPNGQVIINVIPLLQKIIGNQSEVPELGPLENRNMFQLFFCKFTSVFAKKKHPLVMFLDDLQWADIASLWLLKMLSTDSAIESFLFIGAYRENEVNDEHPLTLTLHETKKRGATVKLISLGSLVLSDVQQMNCTTLHISRKKALPLAELVYQKTDGNPFFINEFLKSLYTKKILKHVGSSDNGCWEWDIQEVNALMSTENVVNLLTAKISTLAEPALKALKLAACIGNRFPLKTLALLFQKSKYDAFSNFAPLVREGFVHYNAGYYNFAHDRVQEAVYSFISDKKKQEIHYKIGTLLLADTKISDVEKNIFPIMDQLNAGLDIITKKKETMKFAELNLLAGKKALALTAYQAAIKYLRAGIRLAGDNSWQDAYRLSLDLYTSAAEAAYLCRDFVLMETMVQIVKTKAKTILDVIKVYEIKIQANFAQNNLSQAINTGCRILKQLGVTLPKKPRKLHVLTELIKTKLALRAKSMQYFRNLPKMTNPYKIAIINIMLGIGTSAYFTTPNLLSIMIFKVMRMCARYGNSPISSFYYAAYAYILCGVLGDITSGYKFGEFAVQLLESTDSRGLYAKVYLAFNIFISHWKIHLKRTLQPLIKGYETGLETGDLEAAATCALVYCLHLTYSGEKLSQVNKETLKYLKAVENLKEQRSQNTIGLERQFVLNLMGHSSDRTLLIGDSFNEKEMLPVFIKNHDRQLIAGIYYCKSILNYLFYDYEEAFKNSVKATPYIKSLNGTFHIPIYYFYRTLSCTALYPSAPLLKKMNYWYIINKNRKKMRKWSRHAPMNHLHKFYLLEAECFSIVNKKEKAAEFYEKALTLARKNKYKIEEALANELAGKFYLSAGEKHTASRYIKAAYQCYGHWEAHAKVKHLAEQYPDILTPASLKEDDG
jgi:predicted ATPase